MSETANILLVDDEPGMLRYIRTLLEVDEHKVQTASTGEEAVERVQKGLQPDLVLLDLLMPGIDGLQTLEQLRHLKPGLKVVMLSCVNDTRKVVQAMRLGAVDYLTKPFQKAELDAVGWAAKSARLKRTPTPAISRNFRTTCSSSLRARR
jgi:CheY-like chemotaxis protein